MMGSGQNDTVFWLHFFIFVETDGQGSLIFEHGWSFILYQDSKAGIESYIDGWFKQDILYVKKKKKKKKKG
jgi:hypothetical protein